MPTAEDVLTAAGLTGNVCVGFGTRDTAYVQDFNGRGTGYRGTLTSGAGNIAHPAKLLAAWPTRDPVNYDAVNDYIAYPTGTGTSGGQWKAAWASGWFAFGAFTVAASGTHVMWRVDGAATRCLAQALTSTMEGRSYDAFGTAATASWTLGTIALNTTHIWVMAADPVHQIWKLCYDSPTVRPPDVTPASVSPDVGAGTIYAGVYTGGVQDGLYAGAGALLTDTQMSNLYNAMAGLGGGHPLFNSEGALL